MNTFLIYSVVSEFMSKPAITISAKASMNEAQVKMRENRISGLPVVDEDGMLKGIVSLENIILALQDGRTNEPVVNHMVKNVVCLQSDMDISTVMEIISTHPYGRYPVVDKDKRVVGVVTKGDVMFNLFTKIGTVYLHDKKLEKVLRYKRPPVDTPPSVAPGEVFSFDIRTTNLDEAGNGSALLKKWLLEKGFPEEHSRRAVIATYEAEVNVVLHAGGKGCIKAELAGPRLLIGIVDNGPGIEDVELAVKPGYTTASDEVRERGFGAGMGLHNIKKYSDKLVILSGNAGVKIEMIINSMPLSLDKSNLCVVSGEVDADDS